MPDNKNPIYIPFKNAPRWRRIVAGLINLAACAAVAGVLGTLVFTVFSNAFAPSEATLEEAGSPGGFFIVLLAGVLIYGLTVLATCAGTQATAYIYILLTGRSLGGKIMRLQVLGKDGRILPPQQQAFVRTMLFWNGFLFITYNLLLCATASVWSEMSVWHWAGLALLPLLVNMLSFCIHPQRRSLQDLFFGTRVVQEGESSRTD